jgi:hypothetical protein
MKSVTAATIVLILGTLASGTASARSAPTRLEHCTARIVYSEELPFAPIGSWLVRTTLEITSKNGAPYYTTSQEWMRWQGPPPRRGQAFRAWCDPANPAHWRQTAGAAAKSVF